MSSVSPMSTSIQTQVPSQRQPYTILRVKRKRNEEPLDALVVESRMRRKRSRGGLDLFQFAETVEPGVWDDERISRDLQERISTLAREQPPRAGPQPSAAAQIPLFPPPNAGRQYTIVSHEAPSSRAQASISPPKVISVKDVETQKPDFQMYDAVPTAEAPAPAMDPEMAKFLPLLQEYLKVSDVMPPPTPPTAWDATQGAQPIAVPAPPPSKEDLDYVWDVFYHRAGPLSEYDKVSNIGTLTGLPASFADPFSSESESEPEDEADEDSNAEEYYKNEYPDETDSEGSDIFHEHSDHDESMRPEDADVDYDLD